MGRPKKYPGYDRDRIMKEMIDEVTDYYLAGAGLEKEHSIRDVARKFGITSLKVRKILITAGVYETDVSHEVQDLYEQGSSIEEIQKMMKMGRASVYSYLPYSNTIYNAREKSANAERHRVFRYRKACVEKLKNSSDADQGIPEEVLWEALEAFAGYSFYTVKGMKFSYAVKGYEMYVDRKAKSITKATVLLFAERARELQAAGQKITGPKQIGTFGATYLFPIFVRLGLIEWG